MDIYDHTGTLITTLQNDGSGFQPERDVLQVMESEIRSAGLDILSGRQKTIMLDAMFLNIEAGTPA